MMAMIELVAGIGWEPHIRGLLTVALAFAILGGSVWLLLVTNTGTRLGSLIALAGFWGWMFVMGIFWWIYGIGWAGSLPSWEVQDVFIDAPGAEVEGLQEAFVGNVADLPDGNCFNDTDHFPPPNGVAAVSLDSSANIWTLCTPRAIDLLMAYDGESRNVFAQDIINPQTAEGRLEAIAATMFDQVETPQSREVDGQTELFCSGSSDELIDDQAICVDGAGAGVVDMLGSLPFADRDDLFDAQIAARLGEIGASAIAANDTLGSDDPRFLTGAALQTKIDEDIDNAMLRIDQITLSQLEALAPSVEEWAEEEGLLRLCRADDCWTLQSTSQSGEAAATADAFLREDLFPDGNFLVLDAFQQGGKDKRDGRGLWDRISHKVSSTVQITHPTNYTVVNVQETIEKIPDPAKPPPVNEIDPEEPTYSVVLTRNLGNLRLIPGLFTFVSLFAFLATCLVLHWRDLGLREKGIEA